MTGLELLFAAFGVLAGAAALLAVTSRQVVHAALWLVVALGALAGVYLVLGAEVVALVQLLVYVGEVVVLVLFALMLTRAPIGVRKDLDAGRAQRVAAALAGAALAGLVGGTLLVAVGDTTIVPDLARGGPRPIGEAVFGGWALPFELLSLLLLAALVGALALSSEGSFRRASPKRVAAGRGPAPGGPAAGAPAEGASSGRASSGRASVKGVSVQRGRSKGRSR